MSSPKRWNDASFPEIDFADILDSEEAGIVNDGGSQKVWKKGTLIAYLNTLYQAVSTALLAAQNLADLDDVPTAQQNLNLEPSVDVQVYNVFRASITDAASGRTALALGTAAQDDTGDFATAAQGTLADSALQSGDNISELTNDENYTSSDVAEVITETWEFPRINFAGAGDDFVVKGQPSNASRADVGFGDGTSGANIEMYSKNHATTPSQIRFVYGHTSSLGSFSWIHYDGSIYQNQATLLARTGIKFGAGNPTERVDVSGNIILSGVLYLGTYTVSTLPTATVRGFIFVSDETGGATTAFSDGTNWRRSQDRAIVA